MATSIINKQTLTNNIEQLLLTHVGEAFMVMSPLLTLRWSHVFCNTLELLGHGHLLRGRWWEVVLMKKGRWRLLVLVTGLVEVGANSSVMCIIYDGGGTFMNLWWRTCKSRELDTTETMWRTSYSNWYIHRNN